jgi:hypothetical protein
VSDYGVDEVGFPGRSNMILPLTSVSRLVQGPILPPVQRVIGVISPVLKGGQSVTLTTKPI